MAQTTQDTSSRKDSTSSDNSGSSRRRSSLFQRLRRGSRDTTASKDETRRRSSISDSGPLIFKHNERLGKEVLVPNPHWPNEDSWKRVKESEGQWALGSMAGQQNADFGGTVG